MRDLITKIQQKENLAQDEIESILHEIMSGEAAEEDIRDFLLALNAKGPTIDEITGAARILRKFSVPVKSKKNVVLDTCGTGGDQKHTFNISTVTALVVAGAGVTVAKHGNRSVSSKCGSADVLEALGVNLSVEEQHLSRCLDEVGIAFLFAQRLHPAMKNVAPVRKALGVKTLFNLLGPLINPAKASHQIMGVYSRELVEPLANVFKNLGSKRALVVHGADGLDEISTTDQTFISEWNGKEVISYTITPEDVGIDRAKEEELKGADVLTNVDMAMAVLKGIRGPQRDIVVLNAAYALYTAEVVDQISKGIELACQSIDENKALEKLEALKTFTQQFP